MPHTLLSSHPAALSGCAGVCVSAGLSRPPMSTSLCVCWVCRRLCLRSCMSLRLPVCLYARVSLSLWLSQPACRAGRSIRPITFGKNCNASARAAAPTFLQVELCRAWVWTGAAFWVLDGRRNVPETFPNHFESFRTQKREGRKL